MYDIITFGSASFDTLLESPHFQATRDPFGATSYHLPVGAKVDVQEQFYGVGGGAINAAITFARQNFRTGVVGHVADDVFGKIIKAKLVNEQVSTEHLLVVQNHQTAYSTIVLGQNGERTVLVYRGDFPTTVSNKPPVTNFVANWFYITSLGGDLHRLAKIIKHAQENRIKIALNPGALELSQKELIPLLMQIDVLLVNSSEANYLLPKEETLHSRFKALCGLTDAITIITNGQHGAAVCDGRKVYYMPSQETNVVDTLGAGDAFGSGFVSGLMRFEGSIISAFMLATANAAAVCSKRGANGGALYHDTPYHKGHVTEHPL